MSTKKPCPFCRSTNVEVENDGHFHVRCQSCGATGPDKRTWAEAETAWDRRETDGDGR